MVAVWLVDFCGSPSVPVATCARLARVSAAVDTANGASHDLLRRSGGILKMKLHGDPDVASAVSRATFRQLGAG